MELKSQNCSLELSKRLQELGVKQESLWWWTKLKFKLLDLKGKEYQWAIDYTYNRKKDREYLYSAFTVAELGEMLPCDYITWKSKKGKKWVCRWLEDYKDERLQKATTEANARAKMLIYLLENKLIKSGGVR